MLETMFQSFKKYVMIFKIFKINIKYYYFMPPTTRIMRNTFQFWFILKNLKRQETKGRKRSPPTPGSDKKHAVTRDPLPDKTRVTLDGTLVGFRLKAEGTFGNSRAQGAVWQKRGDGTLCRHVPWRRPHAGKLFCLLVPIVSFFFALCPYCALWLLFLSTKDFYLFFLLGYGYCQVLFLTTSSPFQIYRSPCRKMYFRAQKREEK